MCAFHAPIRFDPALITLVLAFAVAACTSGSDRHTDRVTGYGPFPDDYRDVVETHLTATGGSSLYDLVEWTEPKAHYERIDGVWLYGWRVCVGLRSGAREIEDARPLGYFLIRNGDVIHANVGRPVDGDIDGLAAADRCPSYLAGRVVPKS